MGFLGRASALVALAAVLYALGWRAVLRTLQDADVMSDDGNPSRQEAVWRGLLATAVVARWEGYSIGGGSHAHSPDSM